MHAAMHLCSVHAYPCIHMHVHTNVGEGEVILGGRGSKHHHLSNALRDYSLAEDIVISAIISQEPYL